MRDLITLYEVLLKQIEDKIEIDPSCTFICNIITNSNNNTFSYEEEEILFNHFISQRPSESINSEFTNFRYYNTNSIVWWSTPFMTYEIQKKCNEQRILFLKHIINKLKQQNEEKT